MIKIGHRTIQPFRISKLQEMKIKIPNGQRILENQKVKMIVDYQLGYIKSHSHPNFLGVINVHRLLPTDEYFLIDGQHRFKAGIVLYEKYSHDIDLVVELVDVKEKSELIENYNLINKNTPLPEFPSTIDKNIPKETAKYFQQKYPEVWSDKTRTRRPKMVLNDFQETLGLLAKNLKHEIGSSMAMIEKVEKINKELSIWDKKRFKNVTESMYEKAKKANFFLGLFPHVSNDDYGYEWGKMVVEKSNRPFKKKGVSIKVKNDTWNLYIGKKHGEAWCIVCDKTKIDSKNFQAGHIISEKLGGKSNIHNILPICGQCNRSMGIQSMEEFIKEKYPLNLDNFKNKKYRI